MSRPVSLDETWDQLQKPLKEMLTNKLVGLTSKKYMDLYTLTFKYVSSMNADNAEFYRRVCEMLRNRTAELIKEATPLSDEDLLVFFVKRWEDWSTITRVQDHMMAYLNRTWIKNQRQANANVYEIAMTGDVVWRDSMLVGIKPRLTGAMLRLIKDERDNQQIQPHLIRNCLNCYVRMGLNKDNPKQPTLDVYKEHFEVPFLQATEVYYTGESAKILQEGGVPFYMRKVESRIKEEEERVSHYLHPSTRDPLISKLEHVCIANHKDALHSKFVDLLKIDAIEDLKLMYGLLARVDSGLEPMKALFEKYVKAVGLEAIQTNAKEASEKPQVFVEILLTVFRKYTSLINTAFKNDPGFVASLDKAFREFVNHNVVTEPETGAKVADTVAKAPQILSKYCDLILRKGTFHITDEIKMDETLNDIVSIFKYFPDKDVFMLWYSRLLSKRLINDLSANQDAETNMITKLKAAQGFEYCMKLQRMITDMTLSKDINKDFQETYLEKKKVNLPFSFNIFVLATGSWPLSAPNTDFQVPPDVNPALEHFKGYYDGKYQGRRLMFLHQLARADIQMKVGRLYRLATTAYQMGVLLMFCNVESVSFREMMAQTLLVDKALRVTLLPLVKLKILECSEGEAVKTWTETSTFSVPKKFVSKKPKINCIVTVTLDEKEVVEENAANKAEVDQDRIFKLKAAIVRIMKARKTLSHTDLVQETIGQVNRWFQPKVPMIKKTIESLIEQEYIRRSTDNAKNYEYIA